MKTIPLSGIVGEDFDGPSVRAALASAKGGPVRFELASPGGYVDAGLEIASLIRNYSGPTIMHVIGLAASMASFIACVAKRTTAEAQTVFMIHLPHVGAVGTEHDLRHSAEILAKYGSVMAAGYAEKCGRPLAEVHEIMKRETWYTAEEAMAAGFVDEVVGASIFSSSSTRSRSAAIEAARAQCRKAQGLTARPGELERVAAFLDASPRRIVGHTEEEREALAKIEAMGYGPALDSPKAMAAALPWIALGVDAKDRAIAEKVGITAAEYKDMPRSLRRYYGAKGARLV